MRIPKRKPSIIKDKKLRGEWAESVFMARLSGIPPRPPAPKKEE